MFYKNTFTIRPDKSRSLIKLNKLFISSFTVLICIALQSNTAAQTNNNTRFLPPIISLLLNEQCPSVIPTTTITLNTPLSTQDDLDLLTGVTRIEGDLIFDTSQTTLDFSPLDSLIEVTGGITFDNQPLANIQGFNCLNTVGGELIFLDNNALINIDGFNALTNLDQEIVISNNSALTNIPDFNSLTNLGGRLVITANIELAEFSGFGSLTLVGTNININSNSLLASIPEFNSVTTVGGLININNNNLLSVFSGFNALTNIGAISITNNSSLLDISAFSSLSDVQATLTIAINPSLLDISGFNILESENVIEEIEISRNLALDCITAEPNFLPANISFDNAVDCPTTQ